jgi:predicted transcriptional regulator
MLKPSKRVLTLKKVLEVEAHLLSINKSAYLLGVTTAALSAYIKRRNLMWRGKGIFYKAGITDPYSTRQKILNSDVKQITVYMRMRRKGLRADEAIDYQNNYWTEAETSFLVDNYLLLKYKQLSHVLGKSELSVKSKIKRMGLKKRGVK